MRSTRRFATLNRDGWALESAEARYAESPDTFWIPPRPDRDSIAVGQLAKLLFQIALPEGRDGEFSVERVWVEVTGRIGDTYTAVLRNRPASVDTEGVLDAGDEVLFRAEHVIDIRDKIGHARK